MIRYFLRVRDRFPTLFVFCKECVGVAHLEPRDTDRKPGMNSSLEWKHPKLRKNDRAKRFIGYARAIHPSLLGQTVVNVRIQAWPKPAHEGSGRNVFVTPLIRIGRCGHARVP